jgi:hypothetical protein
MTEPLFNPLVVIWLAVGALLTASSVFFRDTQRYLLFAIGLVMMYLGFQ